MEVFRIHGSTFAPLDGTGAAIRGARWNHTGIPVVYAARSYEGAVLEQLVHAGIGRLPRNRVVSRILIPDSLQVSVLDEVDPDSWEDESRSRAIGSTWLDTRDTVALVVPSAVARPFGQNVLINPRHPDFGRVEVRSTSPVVWDPRLLSGR